MRPGRLRGEKVTYILVGPTGYTEPGSTTRACNSLQLKDGETEEVKERKREKADHHDQNNTLLNPTGTLLSTLRGQISAQLEQNIPSH